MLRCLGYRPFVHQSFSRFDHCELLALPRMILLFLFKAYAQNVQQLTKENNEQVFNEILQEIFLNKKKSDFFE